MTDLYETPVLATTGLPAEYPKWSEKKQKNYLSALAFDGPPGYEPPVIEDPLSRECEGCNAEPYEECRPGCLAEESA